MISIKFSSFFVSIDNSNFYSKVSLDFLSARVKIVASTNQVILICLDDRIPRYYIVRFSQPRSHHGRDLNHYNRARCEFFDPKTWTWKQLQEVKLPKPGLLVTSCMRSISACGSLDWLTWENNVFAFHVKEERYSMFSLPLPVKDKDIELVEYEGKLGLICVSRGEFLGVVGHGDLCQKRMEQKEYNKP
ncbi:unnamed protein product [Dovyalis caffra]|uniref:F-box protein n=1 Tax=Dovyalis caffra TaxID=77055 RepID=A0AAV1SMQ0_9ROSI|nr:unnamed protein product [Dovyalis caffra]